MNLSIQTSSTSLILEKGGQAKRSGIKTLARTFANGHRECHHRHRHPCHLDRENTSTSTSNLSYQCQSNYRQPSTKKVDTTTTTTATLRSTVVVVVYYHHILLTSCKLQPPPLLLPFHTAVVSLSPPSEFYNVSRITFFIVHCFHMEFPPGAFSPW